MIEYHCWGIDPGMEGRPTILNKVKLLYKLLYHMAPEYRPKHLGELRPGRRDAGPRLLSLSLTDPRPLPVSRLYPDLPDTSHALHPYYKRPADAPEDWPDQWVQQRQFSAWNRPHPTEGHEDQREARAAKRRTIRVQCPPFNVKDIVDSIEKVIFRYAYIDLERHTTAAPLNPRPHISATSQEDLLKAVIGSFPAVSSVIMSYDAKADTWKFGSRGKPYVCRGRGPVARMNSSAVDCAIVVGKLLDAGSTVIDRKEPGWPAKFTKAERAFIEATDLNWDVCSPELSISQRDQLWDVLGQAGPGIDVGNLSPFWIVWSACTRNFAQFQFRYSETTSNCMCSGRGLTREECESNFVPAGLCEDEASGVKMEELVSRFFAPGRKDNCAVCHREQSVTRLKQFGNLPLRMAVLCNDAQVKNHTNDISFIYDDAEGIEQRAKYRWLGGVYYKDYHFRVIWTDTARGELGAGSIRYYDSAANCGVILGDIPPGHPHERVPEWWMGEGLIPMLVYERVLDPEPSVLSLAKQSIEDMIGAQSQQKFILDAHAPWARPSQPPGLSTQLWERILPEHAQRFYTSEIAYLPGEPIQPSPRNVYGEFIRQDTPTRQMMRGYLPDPMLPQMVSPSDRMNQVFPRLRSRTPTSGRASSPILRPSSPTYPTRASPMQIDRSNQTPPGYRRAMFSPPIPSAFTRRAGCAKRPRPSGEEEATEQHDTVQKRRKTVRFDRTDNNRNDREPRRSPRLSKVVNA